MTKFRRRAPARMTSPALIPTEPWLVGKLIEVVIEVTLLACAVVIGVSAFLHVVG